MSDSTTPSFSTALLRPATPDDNPSWCFVILPREVSETLPRRGRTTVEGTINDFQFQATLEPDGKLSHWLRIDENLLKTTGLKSGENASFSIWPAGQEPEPEVPEDLQLALASAPEARTVWKQTTTIARLDWIHWITSAKQTATRQKRIRNACDMLASGKKRVCCFDPSGYYSKALKAPDAAG